MNKFKFALLLTVSLSTAALAKAPDAPAVVVVSSVKGTGGTLVPAQNIGAIAINVLSNGNSDKPDKPDKPPKPMSGGGERGDDDGDEKGKKGDR